MTNPARTIVDMLNARINAPRPLEQAVDSGFVHNTYTARLYRPYYDAFSWGIDDAQFRSAMAQAQAHIRELVDFIYGIPLCDQEIPAKGTE